MSANDPGLTQAENSFVEAWARENRFNRYRNYPLISSSDAARVLTDNIATPGPDVTRLWLRHGNSIAGLIRIVDLPWDTALYGRRMGRISHLCGDLSDEEIRSLVDETDYEHLAIRIDASDSHTQQCIVKAGFFPVDSILTYLYYPAGVDLPDETDGRTTRQYTFRPYEPADRDRILHITSRSYGRYAGRYYADPLLRKRSAERYLEWARKCVDGEADQICVSECNGRVVGYVAFRYDRSLYRVLGIGNYGSGLGASSGGNYLKLLRYTLMCDKAIHWHFAECDTQIDNYHVHRIYQSLKLNYVRAEHTYHLHRI